MKKRSLQYVNLINCIGSEGCGKNGGLPMLGFSLLCTCYLSKVLQGFGNLGGSIFKVGAMRGGKYVGVGSLCTFAWVRVK